MLLWAYSGKEVRRRVGNQMDQPEKLEITSRNQAECAGAQIVAINIAKRTVIEKQNRASFAAQKHGRRVAELSERIRKYEVALETWAGKNRRKEFGESKTLELRHVMLEFKLTPRGVRFLEGWTAAKCLEKLRKMGDEFAQYIRVKEDLDKQRILADSKPEVARLDSKTMRRFGVEVGQDENFNVSPKLEQAPA